MAKKDTAEKKPDPEVEELESKYGVLGEDFIFLHAGGTRVVLKRPDPDDYDKSQNNLRNVKVKKSQVIRQICFDSAAEPAKPELEKVFARYPHLPWILADELSILAGSDLQVIAKKG